MTYNLRKILFKFCALAFFVLSEKSALAQRVTWFLIKGEVVDSVSNKPIEFATISILDVKHEVIALTYSDENGLFKSTDVSVGQFSLNLSFVGYKQKNISFNVSSAGTVELGTIFMQSEATLLKTVTISGTKQLVEQQPGMLIYNAEKDISNMGGTAADVLRKAPILNVDAAGNVSMRGSSNLRILINGKYSGQMARNSADALNMMPAGMIKSVEVITSPSARYDAEGAAGVINIITKKGNQNSSGTIEAVIGNLEQAINPRIAINRDKWNWSSTLHLHRFRNKQVISMEREILENDRFAGKIIQDEIQDNTKPHSSGDFQVEYAPDSANHFNFSVNAWLGSWPQNSEQNFRSFDAANVLINQYHQFVKTKAPRLGADLNIGYTRKFRKPGEELYLIVQHNRSHDQFNYDALQQDREHVLSYREINDNRNTNHEWTFQSDFILPFGNGSKHALETGLKAILRNATSDFRVSASDTYAPEVLMPVQSRTDVFNYSQDVVAGYSQLKFKWAKGWALHAGARVEGTLLEGNQKNVSTHFANNFWNFIPSATLFKKLNANNNLTFSYTKRISRPSIWDLNPNREMQNPSNINVGNPMLRPEEVDQTELTYALHTDSDLFFNVSAFAKKTANSIESIVTVDAVGVATTTKQNLASNSQFGVNFSSSLSILSSWKINGNASMRYAKFESGALGIKNGGAAWGLNLNSSWKLPKQYTVQMYGDYDARSVTLQGFKTSWLYYSFSAKKELPARKLTIALTAVSPFSNYRFQSEVVRSADFSSTFQKRYLIRSVRLSVNWEFGGMVKVSNRRNVKNDDQKNVRQGG
jgi:outer membrane receptor protein involved in Fe transport